MVTKRLKHRHRRCLACRRKNANVITLLRLFDAPVPRRKVREVPAAFIVPPQALWREGQ